MPIPTYSVKKEDKINYKYAESQFCFQRREGGYTWILNITQVKRLLRRVLGCQDATHIKWEYYCFVRVNQSCQNNMPQIKSGQTEKSTTSDKLVTE